MNSHPNPGNRFARINDEAQTLRVSGNYSSGQFQTIQARLRDAGKSYTAEEIAQGRAKTNTGTAGSAGRVNTRIEPPSSSTRAYRPTDFLQVTVPSNWSQINANSGVTYAPQGAFYESQGGTAFTHGVQFGVAQGSNSNNLQRDTQALLQGFAKSNPDLRQTSGFSRVNMNGRQGLVTQLRNTSEVTGQPEYIQLTTTYLRDGSVLYMIGVAPQNEANTYTNAFNRVRSNLRIADR